MRIEKRSSVDARFESMTRRTRMDDRVRTYLESKVGLSLEDFPPKGISVRESPKRTDEPGNRFLIQRIADRDGVLITAIPRIVKAIASAVQSVTPWEVFSPLGAAEIKRVLGNDAESLDQFYIYGFDYILTDSVCFRPAETQYAPVTLTKKDIPPEQFELRMSERLEPVSEDFVWAFACYHNDSEVRATELAPFGLECASIAIVIWKPGPVATYGIWTEEACRGQGYALAAVSAATKWILEQDAIAVYGAYANNIPSLRIARRLGFTLVHQEMGA